MRSSFKSGKCNKVTAPLLLEFVMSKSIRFSGRVKVHLWNYPPDVVELQCCSVAADRKKDKTHQRVCLNNYCV